MLAITPGCEKPQRDAHVIGYTRWRRRLASGHCIAQALARGNSFEDREMRDVAARSEEMRASIPSPAGFNLQPAFLPRQPVRLDAVADSQFADRLGQIVAHRALRQMQLLGDVGGR